MSVNVVREIECVKAVHADEQDVLYRVASLGDRILPRTHLKRRDEQRSGQGGRQKGFGKTHFKFLLEFGEDKTLTKKEIRQVNNE
jgi:hypothetical protein